MSADRTSQNGHTNPPLDVVVVGAGFAGMYALHKFRTAGFSVRCIEAAPSVGGTWFWNRYPGARCDVPSLDYSYSFSEELQQEWVWTERYAAQPEIERYANFVANRLDLRRDITFNSRVIAASFDESNNQWRITTEVGEVIVAQFCVMATGGYSVPIVPQLEGLDEYAGEMYFTAKWPREPVSFEGRRVAVIGTGASGMQTIQTVVDEGVEELFVFQRTANFAIPARNRPLDDDEQREYKAHYAQHRARSLASGFGVGLPFVGTGRTAELSEEEFERRFVDASTFGGSAVLAAFPDVLMDEASNERVSERIRQDIRSRVDDPEIAELLCPRGHFLGARRLLIETSYLEAFNQPNVHLIDVRTQPIERLTKTGVRTTEQDYEVDIVVLATGFNSGSGAVLAIDFEGIGGLKMSTAWREGPRSYLGMMVPNFPNLFLVAAPGSPSIRVQGILIGEVQVDWFAQLMTKLRDENIDRVEPTPEATSSWTAYVADTANRGLLARNETQYVGANVPGKPRVYSAYLGGLPLYRAICNGVADDKYPGFVFRTGDETTCADEIWAGPPEGVLQVSAI